MDSNSRKDPDIAGAGPVLILDSAPEACLSVEAGLSKAGFAVINCVDAGAVIELCETRTPSCILVDLVLPNLSGLQVIEQLRNRGCHAPILVTSGKSDIATAVRVMKGGAFDFIEKPIQSSDLIPRIRAALSSRGDRRRSLRFHFPRREPLTSRETEVLAKIIAGQATKEIAQELQLSSRTVESHRATIMRKVGARNIADLVRMAIAAVQD